MAKAERIRIMKATSEKTTSKRAIKMTKVSRRKGRRTVKHKTQKEVEHDKAADDYR